MKDLPKVFANPIDKDIRNNSTFSYGILEEEPHDRDEKKLLEKLDKLFKSDSYIYSIDCVVKFENGEEKHTIIGRTSNNLVTKNQKIIPIKDIYDINLA